MRFAPPSPTPPGLARRVPPAIFPPVMGLFGLGLAWRRFGALADLPAALAEVILGAVTLLFLFTLAAYAVKLLRRPAVLAQDLAVLPGRLGVSALFANLYLLAIVLFPYLPGLSAPLIWSALIVQLAVMALIGRALAKVPPAARQLRAAGHLYFTSPLVGAMAAALTGEVRLGAGLLLATLVIGAAIWAADIHAMLRGRLAPPPLRPILALHLSVSSVAGITAGALGWAGTAQGFAWLSCLTLLLFILSARWLTQAGFSALWSAFTFPLAATASLWLAQGGLWLWPGQVVLLAATGVVPAIALRVMKMWAGGQLAVKTNAASA